MTAAAAEIVSAALPGAMAADLVGPVLPGATVVALADRVRLVRKRAADRVATGPLPPADFGAKAEPLHRARKAAGRALPRAADPVRRAEARGPKALGRVPAAHPARATSAAARRAASNGARKALAVTDRRKTAGQSVRRRCR